MTPAAATAHDPLAAAVIAALMSDPDAVALLRKLLVVEGTPPGRPARPPAYTVESLASALGVSAKAVRNAIARGDLAAVKRAGRWLIPADAVDAWTRVPEDTRVRRRTSRRNTNGPLAEVFERLDPQARSA